jgi:hypothetical protein
MMNIFKLRTEDAERSKCRMFLKRGCTWHTGNSGRQWCWCKLGDGCDQGKITLYYMSHSTCFYISETVIHLNYLLHISFTAQIRVYMLYKLQVICFRILFKIVFVVLGIEPRSQACYSLKYFVHFLQVDNVHQPNHNQTEPGKRKIFNERNLISPWAN